MSSALSILQGNFGRVALLDMDRSLVTHAHRACHVLLKFGGADTAFDVRGRRCPLTYQSGVVVNAWEEHAYVHAGGAPQTHILALYIDPTWLGSIDSQLISSGHAQFFTRATFDIDRNAREKAQSLGARMLGFDAMSRTEAECAVFDLMTDIIDGVSNRKSLRSERAQIQSSDFRIRKAICWLRERVAEPIDLDALARVAGLSRAHFFSQFRKMTGLSPAMFLNTLRMEAATGMLTQEDRPLSDISHDLGFSAQSNFSRFFREHQGVTPSEYRRVAHVVE